jgi:hypothetical protein
VGRQQGSLTVEVEQVIDAVCALGCNVVCAYITGLRNGEIRPEYSGLDADQRKRLLEELEAIMSVYKDGC